MNIVLVGFMATGKSAVAKVISAKTGMTLVELDAEIGKSAQKTIAQIFETEGEASFRNRESEECSRAAAKSNAVISCGGGVVLRPHNVALLKKNGRVFWLKASVEAVIERASKKPELPPLLKGLSREKIAHLMASREPFYTIAADEIIDTDGKSAQQVADEILSLS